MTNKYYYALLVLLFILSNCKKAPTPPSVFAETSYPLAVGDWWQYQVNQTNEGGSYDTIMLNVLSVSAYGQYAKFMCNIILNGSVIDSGYFLQSDTSLSFINISNAPDYSLFPNFHLKFPVDIGQSWPGAFPGDSTLVVGVANQNCYVKTYGPCYYTNEICNVPHYFKRETMTLTPKIGLVNQSMDYKSDTAEPLYGIPGVQLNQSITLINYHVQ